MSPERATATADDDSTASEQPVVEVAIERIDGAARSARADWLAVEEPLEIRLVHGRVNARKRTSLTVTMRTPGNDIELAVGFLSAEGVVRGLEDIQGAESCGPARWQRAGELDGGRAARGPSSSHDLCARGL